MPNPYVNKVISNGVTKLDLTFDTVTADKLAQGYTAHDASGQSIVGTMSGGGTGGVTQDAQGYLVLSDQGGDTPTPSGGLEYETGTWTPSEDTRAEWISFTDSHTALPMYLLIEDADASNTPSSAIGCFSLSNYSSFGIVGNSHLAFLSRRYKDSSGIWSNNTLNITSSGELADYVTTTQFRAVTTSSSSYWKAGRTYKWIAVWAPTS